MKMSLVFIHFFPHLWCSLLPDVNPDFIWISFCHLKNYFSISPTQSDGWQILLSLFIWKRLSFTFTVEICFYTFFFQCLKVVPFAYGLQCFKWKVECNSYLYDALCAVSFFSACFSDFSPGDGSHYFLLLFIFSSFHSPLLQKHCIWKWFKIYANIVGIV